MAEKFWYLSFADADRPTGEQFLGGCIVAALDLPGAITASHVLGINPGGEVQVVEIPEGAVAPAKYRDRLLSREDIEAWDREEGKDG